MNIFIISKNGDVDIYKSVDEAERSMESQDIESGEYKRAFDASGNVFDIGTSGTKKQLFWLISSPGILKPTGENAATELHEILSNKYSNKLAGTNPTLQDFVNIAISIQSNAKGSRSLIGMWVLLIIAIFLCMIFSFYPPDRPWSHYECSIFGIHCPVPWD